MAALVGLAALLSMTSCGFHLEGSEPLPRSLALVHVEDVDTQSDFYFALRAALRASGARIEPAVPSAISASTARALPNAATIQVLADATTQRTLSVSAQNIPNEFQLTYAVTVAVRAGGRQLMAPQVFRLVRDYNFAPSELLAKNRERGILSQALANELASIVMRRLSSL